MSEKLHIALTNDDGIQAIGLRALYSALLKAGHRVSVIAPVSEQSAVGHALTIFNPLRLKLFDEQNFKGYGVYGTPSDCVKLGMIELLKNDRPNLMLSGINAGANVGPDILYSGTVAAATEAAHLGFSAMAVSFDSYKPADLTAHADYAVKVMEQIDWSALPGRSVINLNLPNLSVDNFKGLAVCPQTSALWSDEYKERHDPRGNSYWWMEGIMPESEVEQYSDRGMLWQGYATITPLKFEFTDHASMNILNGLQIKI